MDGNETLSECFRQDPDIGGIGVRISVSISLALILLQYSSADLPTPQFYIQSFLLGSFILLSFPQHLSQLNAECSSPHRASLR